MSFGQEQAVVETDVLRRWTLKAIGNPHAGANLRWRALLLSIRMLEEEYGLRMTQSHILDAGSGKGEYSFALSRQFLGVRVTGIELDSKQVERANRAAKLCGAKDVTFHQGKLENIRFDSVFHLAICLDVIQYISADDLALELLWKALKPEGYLILHAPGEVKAHFGVVDTNKLISGYSINLMMNKLERAGFEVVCVTNPIGILGQYGDDLCELLATRPVLRGLAIPMCSSLVWLDRFDSLWRPEGGRAGILAVARRPMQRK